MKTVSMLEFRRKAAGVLKQLRKGERFVLTYRGQPVARLEPILEARTDAADPFYTLGELADAEGESLTNPQVDEILYGA
jgi:prevent-host-death family protein